MKLYKRAKYLRAGSSIVSTGGARVEWQARARARAWLLVEQRRRNERFYLDEREEVTCFREQGATRYSRRRTPRSDVGFRRADDG